MSSPAAARLAARLALCARALARGGGAAAAGPSAPPPFAPAGAWRAAGRRGLAAAPAAAAAGLAPATADSNAASATTTSTTTSADGVTTTSPGYDASRIQVLQGLDPVRKRPGMYIGSTGQRGLHHLVYEILDNAVDEVQGGHAASVWVELDARSGWVGVRDDGRGIPTDLHPTTGLSALETVLTVLHAGGKFGGDASGYAVSGGLHGVGLSVVNALSEELQVRVWRGGAEHAQAFARGAAAAPLARGAAPPGAPAKGTQVRFRYDPEIFAPTATFDPDTLRNRLRELAFLNPAATIRFRVLGEAGGGAAGAAADAAADAARGPALGAGDGPDAPAAAPRAPDGAPAPAKAASASTAAAPAPAAPTPWEVYHYSGGIAEYAAHLNRDRAPLHAPLVFQRKVEGVEVAIALQWCADSFSDTLVGFVNSVKTVDGGTHIDGFKAALTRTGALFGWVSGGCRAQILGHSRAPPAVLVNPSILIPPLAITRPPTPPTPLLDSQRARAQDQGAQGGRRQPRGRPRARGPRGRRRRTRARA
jgi:DNA gyrase subunit B